MTEPLPVFTRDKVTTDASRTARWLAGEAIYPGTMELDLTDRCTRACPACPFGANPNNTRALTLPFLDRLFGILDGRTPGLILSGGEPTISPVFAETLALARRRGFRQIATITNGTRLDQPAVRDALLEHGTAARVSLYDWERGRLDTVHATLERVCALRARAEREGSRLELGVAMLTSRARVPHFARVAEVVARSGGPHWLYFHPFCRDWEERPVQEDQTGVLDELDALRKRLDGTVEVQVARDRYDLRPLGFSGFHAAHFLLQVGSDGVNYLAPEAKYRSDAALVQLDEDMPEHFLHHPDRLRRIAAVNSANYAVIGTRHRGSIFSDTLERLLAEPGGTRAGPDGTARFRYPDLL